MAAKLQAVPSPVPSSDSISSSLDRAALIRALVAWFDNAQRDLPWRHAENARDAYRVLVSEVMLQQTTVAAVVPFYRRFLARFPTVQALAAAPQDEVLALWAGLGYYSRARNLHACARAVMERHGGVFPREVAQLLALPGIGRYTAGAVASIAFDAPAPIVDANVARVFARIFALEGDVKDAATQRRLWSEAEKLVEVCAGIGCHPSQLNPALMELGALVCVPNAPRCGECPVRNFCAAFQTGRQDELPRSTPKAAPTPLHDVCAFAVRANEDGEPEILWRQRPHDAKIWWRGMWELPRTTVAEGETPQDALQRALTEIGARGRAQRVLTTVAHGVTRYRITLDCWAVDVEETADFRGRWATPQEAEKLALPSSMRRLLRWLERHQLRERQLNFW